jgi:hypothetical protein
MKFCTTCNRTADDSLNYCSRDGAVLGIGDRYCPACAHIHDRQFHYCPAHGVALVWVPSDTLPLPPTVAVPSPATPRSGRRVLRSIGAAAASLVLFAAGAFLGTYTTVADAERHVEAAPAAKVLSSKPESDSKIKDGRNARIGASASTR